jgi:hypothetical protein
MSGKNNEWKKIMVIVFIREVILYSLENSSGNSSQIGVLTRAKTTFVVITNPQIANRILSTHATPTSSKMK